jgi:hypothetical protein
MPHLPNNLVKPPTPGFDNPIRRTAKAEAVPGESPASRRMPKAEAAPSESPASPVSASPHDMEVSQELGGTVIPIGTNARTDSHPDLSDLAMVHRITVRIDDATRRALEANCHMRRMAGEKTNVAEIARGILEHWAGLAVRTGRAE